MLKINDERKETVSFGSLKVGDVFIDPRMIDDVCLKIDNNKKSCNSFSFKNHTTFGMDNLDEVIPMREAILTIK
jgi:hypothetical protein